MKKKRMVWTACVLGMLALGLEGGRQDVSANEYNLETLHYDQLTEEEQVVYQEMLQAFQNRETEFELSAYDADTAERVLTAIVEGHSELYWIDTLYYGDLYYEQDENGRIVCYVSYPFSDEEMGQIEESLIEAESEIKREISQDADDYEKVKMVYEYVVENVAYVDNELRYSQGLAGALWKKECVCAGYARAIDYLLEKLEVPCIVCSMDPEHAANIVQIDGEYYIVDATNGDGEDGVYYAHLCPPPEQYETFCMPNGDGFDLPELTADDLDYYKRNGNYFESYDDGEMLAYCEEKIAEGVSMVEFKFSNQEAYEAAIEAWYAGSSDAVISEILDYYRDVNGLVSADCEIRSCDDAYQIIRCRIKEGEEQQNRGEAEEYIQEFEGHGYGVYRANEMELSGESENIFAEVEEYFESMGGHLVIIETPEENEFVYGLLADCEPFYAFFGLTDEETEGTWKWVTGEMADYTNWADGEPNGLSDENYGCFYEGFDDSKWNDGAIDSETLNDSTIVFICEWDDMADLS